MEAANHRPAMALPFPPRQLQMLRIQLQPQEEENVAALALLGLLTSSFITSSSTYEKSLAILEHNDKAVDFHAGRCLGTLKISWLHWKESLKETLLLTCDWS